MKVRVKNGCSVYYGLTLYKSGDIVNYKSDKVPAWGMPIENDEKTLAQFAAKKTVSKNTEIKDDTQDKTQDNTALTEKYNTLLDEAVSLGIAFQPDENATIKANIALITDLIEKQKQTNI